MSKEKTTKKTTDKGKTGNFLTPKSISINIDIPTVLIGILGIIFAVLLAIIPYLISLTNNLESRINGLKEMEETLSLLIEINSDVQRISLDSKNKKYEMVKESCEELEVKLLDKIAELDDDSRFKNNLKELLKSIYVWDAVTNYRIKKGSFPPNEGETFAKRMQELGDKIIELDKDYWKGYQLRAFGVWESPNFTKESLHLVVSDLDFSITKGGKFNPNSINLPEVYFIHNDFDNAYKSAKRFCEKFDGQIHRYRSEGGQIAFYIYFHLSRYILEKDDKHLEDFRKAVEGIFVRGDGSFDSENLINWFKDLDNNPTIKDAEIKCKLKGIFNELPIREKKTAKYQLHQCS